jgi:polo-like kinase 4
MIAVKKIDKRRIRSEKVQQVFKREVSIHSRLRHENIVRLYTAYESPGDAKYLYLFLEYAEKGNLFFLIRNKRGMTEAEAFFYFI